MYATFICTPYDTMAERVRYDREDAERDAVKYMQEQLIQAATTLIIYTFIHANRWAQLFSYVLGHRIICNIYVLRYRHSTKRVVYNNKDGSALNEFC